VPVSKPDLLTKLSTARIGGAVIDGSVAARTNEMTVWSSRGYDLPFGAHHAMPQWSQRTHHTEDSAEANGKICTADAVRHRSQEGIAATSRDITSRYGGLSGEFHPVPSRFAAGRCLSTSREVPQAGNVLMVDESTVSVRTIRSALLFLTCVCRLLVVQLASATRFSEGRL
jgi:hypothetical protein